ncbi:unnamed protein product [Caretta caretta]
MKPQPFPAGSESLLHRAHYETEHVQGSADTRHTNKLHRHQEIAPNTQSSGVIRCRRELDNCSGFFVAHHQLTRPDRCSEPQKICLVTQP